MKKLWLVSAGLVALSGSMFGDTINAPTSTGQLNAVPLTATFVGLQPSYPNTSVVNNTQPFWNDPSSDSGGAIVHANFANVGDVLSGYATGTSPLAAANVSGGNIVPGSYYASATGNGDPISVTAPGAVAGLPGTDSVVPALEFNFLSSQTAMAISLLFADSSQDSGPTTGTTFGTYIVPGGGSIQEYQLGVGIGDTTTPTAFGSLPANFFNNGTVYGFYATVCYASPCGTNSVTYTTGVGNFSTGTPAGSGYLGGLGWNHFSFFELANGDWALGFSDTPWALGTPNSVSGLGDFNDAIFGITGNAAFGSAAPEPGTIAIMGLGLAGLGLIGRRRFAKK